MLCFLKGTVRVRTRRLVAFGRPVTGQPKYAPYAFGVSRLLLNAYMLFQVLHGSLSCLGQGPVYSMAHTSNSLMRSELVPTRGLILLEPLKESLMPSMHRYGY
jgi:hypothetical protein